AARSMGIPLVLKPCSLEELDVFLSSAAALAPLRASRALHWAVIAIVRRCSLIAQESRILAVLAAGSTRRTLARDLGMSENTLKSQLRGVLTKVNVRTTDDLVAMILRSLA